MGCPYAVWEQCLYRLPLLAALNCLDTLAADFDAHLSLISPPPLPSHAPLLESRVLVALYVSALLACKCIMTLKQSDFRGK